MGEFMPITNRFELVYCSGNTSNWTPCGEGFTIPKDDAWILRKTEIFFEGDNEWNVSFRIVLGGKQILPKNQEGFKGNNQWVTVYSDERLEGDNKLRYEYKNLCNAGSTYAVMVNFSMIETEVGR